MRETSKSLDDVAVDAAKEKLVALATRPGFDQAMVPEPTGSSRGRTISIGAAVMFVGLAIASLSQISATWLQILLGLLFVVFAVMATFAAIGFSPDRQALPTPAVVVRKWLDAHSVHMIALLDQRGETREVMAIEGVWTSLRAGDVGVAHVRPGRHPILIELHRL